MTRTGKIARLPRALREQLNQRLQNGEASTTLLAWLNLLPEVQTILQDQFAGNPVTKQNLSEWRQGGYVEWEFKQELAFDVAEMSADSEELDSGADAFLSDHLATVLTARYASLLRHWDGKVTDKLQAQLKVLHRMIQNISQIRRWDHNLAKLHLAREKLFPVAASRRSAAIYPSDPVQPNQSEVSTTFSAHDSHDSHSSPDSPPSHPFPEPLPSEELPSMPSIQPIESTPPDHLPSDPVQPNQTTLDEPAEPPPRERTSYDVWPQYVADELDLLTIQSLPVQARPPADIMPNTVYDPQRGTFAALTEPDQPKYPGSLRWGKGLPPEHRPYRPTMCQGKCNLSNGFCTGCQRSVEEITLWPVMKRSERVAYIHKILTRRLATGQIK